MCSQILILQKTCQLLQDSQVVYAVVVSMSESGSFAYLPSVRVIVQTGGEQGGIPAVLSGTGQHSSSKCQAVVVQVSQQISSAKIRGLI